MFSVDAQRIMAVLTGSLEMFQHMTYMVDPVALAELLADLMNVQIAMAVAHHGDCVKELHAAQSKGMVAPELHIAGSTRHLCRLLQADTGSSLQVTSLGTQRSLSLIYLVIILGKLKLRMQKRLMTTVEEENSKLAYHTDICRREEKARKEWANLCQQLEVEQRERAKALQSMIELEKRGQDEAKFIQAQMLSRSKHLEEAARAREEVDTHVFQEQEGAITTQTASLQAELKKLQVEYRESEMLLRKKKKSSAEEVVNWLHEYDNDMGARMKEYLEEKASYDVVWSNLATYKALYAKIEAEENEKRAREREIEERLMKIAAQEKARDDAATKIQTAWKAYRTRKQEAAKAANKKGKKEGKKGKGGKKSPKGGKENAKSSPKGSPKESKKKKK